MPFGALQGKRYQFISCFPSCTLASFRVCAPQTTKKVLSTHATCCVHILPSGALLLRRHDYHPLCRPVCFQTSSHTSLLSASHYIYLPFLLSASAFLNGNPLVLLSAPVFLLILPLLLANKMHHSATMARKPEPSVPRLNDVTPVLVHMA